MSVVIGVNTNMADTPELRAEIVSLIPRLRRFALGLTGNSTDADDLVQTALEKALTRLHQFEAGSRLDSWLFRIVQTSWIDNRRRAVRREDTMEAETIERLPEAPIHSDAETRMALGDINSALASLSDDQRVLAVLVLVEGYSYQEAADLEGIPVGTVMSRLSRARKALANQLRGA